MSYGFSISSGTGNVITQVSSDNPPGVYLDSFYVGSSSPVTKSYSDFSGTSLLAQAIPLGTGVGGVIISINNAAKTVSITPQAIIGADAGNVNVVVLGV